MTFVHIEREEVTTTEKTSKLGVGIFRVTITWENGELYSVYLCDESDRPSAFSLYSKYPRDIEMLRDLLSATLVELGIEEAQNDTVGE
ncbi:MAG: hypothetical protein ACYSW3_02125 [Planctomycetota bacterium]|jgi:hypothetical protein